MHGYTSWKLARIPSSNEMEIWKKETSEQKKEKRGK